MPATCRIAHIPQTGELVVEVLKPAVTLEQGKPNSVFGPNGTAIVIHAGVDDYKTDPTGNAGGVSPAASSNSSRAQADSRRERRQVQLGSCLNRNERR